MAHLKKFSKRRQANSKHPLLIKKQHVIGSFKTLQGKKTNSHKRVQKCEDRHTHCT